MCLPMHLQPSLPLSHIGHDQAQTHIPAPGQQLLARTGPPGSGWQVPGSGTSPEAQAYRFLKLQLWGELYMRACPWIYQLTPASPDERWFLCQVLWGLGGSPAPGLSELVPR